MCLAFTNKNRKSTLFNHLSSISEGIPALGWILVVPTPAPYIKEMIEAAQFYTNRVLKDFKEKDPIHVEWVKQWIKILSELYAYVKQYHTTGLTWAKYGQHDSDVSARNLSQSTSAFSNIRIDGNSSRNEVMNSINALDVNATSYLKKVPDELKGHKNLHLKEQPIDGSSKAQVG